MQVPTTALPSLQVLFRPLAELRITAAVRNIIDPNEARDITKSGHPDMVMLTQFEEAEEGAARAAAREAGFKSHDAAETPSSTQPREAPPPPARVNEGVHEGVKEYDDLAMLMAVMGSRVNEGVNEGVHEGVKEDDDLAKLMAVMASRVNEGVNEGVHKGVKEYDLYLDRLAMLMDEVGPTE
jgi:hypothetical protein